MVHEVDDFLPNRERGIIRLEHEHELDAWKMFAGRAQKNPFMKRAKWKEQNGICPCCHRYVSTDEGLLHHMDYECLCIRDTCISFPNPTEKRPHRMVKVPDCEACSRSHPQKFTECASKLVLIHKGCHMRIHGISSR